MIIFGKQPVLYAIAHAAEAIETIFIAKELDKKLFAQLRSAKKPIERLDFKKAQAMARGANHQGVLARIADLGFADLPSALKSAQNSGSALFVALCGVTDVGNIGAITRTAFALGAAGLVISGVKSANLEALTRSSAGAALSLPIFLEPNVLDLIERFKQAGFAVFGADSKGENSQNFGGFSGFGAKRLLLLGAEDEGLADRVLKKCDQKIAIKMSGFDSLNVSAAAAILIDRLREGI
ncbi:MAG: 23S rRNA (guanosine(2251)-2'-O)-methyltransferase RlmB [Helicobacteraceae bacterium]|jgi:23S rRNA (guanosine2251-2'-O)-methyltransferase|nr:23S rRNA (guanosine(2251)-2'-O)-methyltransferase RlmB [Helicobacteraceae bacterium]